MDKKLKMLFDYQKFERNKKIDDMFIAANKAYPEKLSEEDLDYVVAGLGLPNTPTNKPLKKP